MTDIMEVLFQYAQEHMVCALVRQEREYANVRLCAEKQEEAFLALLDDAAQKRYEHLLKEQNLLSTLYERAMFRAGFRLAIELSRR